MTLFPAILFSVFTSAMFFIKGQFFAGSGSTDLLSYFASAPYICIIVIPALCARQSVEIYDDFIPQTRLSRLLKRFFSIFLTYSVMILLMLPVCFFVASMGQLDIGQLVAGILCLLLYGACLISLCLLIKELFPNRTACFVISALFLAIFNSIHLLPLYITLPAALASLFRNLSFAWHFDAASKGILDSRDLALFILTTILFIYLNLLIQEIKRGRVFCKKEKALNSGLFCLLLLLILNSSVYFFRLDLSKNQSYSVSAYTKKLTKELDDRLNITYYRSGTLSRLYPQIRDITDFLNSYALQSSKITFSLKDPDKNEEIKSLLENYGITSQQLQNTEGTSTQFTSVYSAIVMEYKGLVQIIPFLMSSQTLEYDLDIRLRNLLTGKNITVNLIIGNGMDLYEDYSLIVMWLNSQGILVNPISLEEPDFVKKLENAKGTLCLIGDSEIDIEKAIAIENYILSQKGSAIMALSPYSAAIDQDWTITANKRTNVVEMLENWGCLFTQQICADISCARITMYEDSVNQNNPFSQTSPAKEVLNYPLWISLLPQQYCKLGMTLFWPVKLELSQNASPYLVTSSSAWTYKTDKASPSKLIESNPFQLQEQTGENYERGTQIIGAQINGPLKGLYNFSSCDDSNILVIPDPYFLNTLMTGYIGGDFGDYRNFEFFSNAVLKAEGEEELALLQSKTVRDSSLNKITDHTQLLKKQLFAYILSFLLLPLCHLLIYTFTRKLKARKREGGSAK